MNSKHYFRIVLAIAAFFFLSGVSVYASETDERIEASAENSYVFKTYLKDDNIKTQSVDGVVILTGTVSEDGHKTLAEETVANLPGVQRVDNQLTVKNDAPEKGSDAWVSMKVKASLLFHNNVSAARTKVDVKEGVVTLRGEAYSQAEKDLATEYARDVEGVKSIRNEMTITNPAQEAKKETKETMGEKIDDASITAQVKTALLFNRSTSGLKMNVDTENGIVTIKGTAKNMAEKDLVTKLASDINGVKSVVNQIEIQ